MTSAQITAIENVIYRRIAKDIARRHMTLRAVELSAIATLESLKRQA